MTEIKKKQLSWDKEAALQTAKRQAEKTGCDVLVRFLEAVFEESVLDTYHVNTSHYDVRVFRSIANAAPNGPARIEIKLAEHAMIEVGVLYWHSLGELSGFIWESKWIDDPDRAREHLSKCLAALDLLSEKDIDPDLLVLPNVRGHSREE
jgi:hypothetical protein